MPLLINRVRSGNPLFNTLKFYAAGSVLILQNCDKMYLLVAAYRGGTRYLVRLDDGSMLTTLEGQYKGLLFRDTKASLTVEI